LKSPRRVLAVVGFWIAASGLFVLRSPSPAYTHDFRGHLQHTVILFRAHRLAFPREGWETYQPPLYYLINCLLVPTHESHVLRVRLMSTLFGGISLLLMSWMLTRRRVAASIQVLVLCFIATTPAFLFLFTTYNNDSLAVPLAMGILITAFEYVSRPERRKLVLLGALTIAGLYTKLSVAFPIVALAVVLGGYVLLGKLAWARVWPVFAVLAVSVLMLAPWLIGHNYRLSGRLIPTSADAYTNDAYHLPHSSLRTVLTPPGWTRGEWKDPFAHVWEAENHKKNSFLAYLFDTSVFGEYTFEFLPAVLPWGMLLIHAGLWLAAIWRARQSSEGLACLGLIVVGFLCASSLIFRAPFGGFMDFRYIAWVWLPGALIYATCLLRQSFFRVVMAVGSLLNASLWLVLVLTGRWNIP
jgi:4-amino-4-deoxy-L-arabinose transferase-like glycosyltransferase